MTQLGEYGNDIVDVTHGASQIKFIYRVISAKQLCHQGEVSRNWRLHSQCHIKEENILLASVFLFLKRPLKL